MPATPEGKAFTLKLNEHSKGGAEANYAALSMDPPLESYLFITSLHPRTGALRASLQRRPVILPTPSKLPANRGDLCAWNCSNHPAWRWFEITRSAVVACQAAVAFHFQPEHLPLIITDHLIG